MKKFLYIFLSFILSAAVGPALADDSTVVYETSTEFPERNFDDSELTKIKSDPDFNYFNNREIEQPSLLDKILYKIISFILEVIFSPAGSPESILFYVLCVALIVGLVFIILRMNAMGLFARNNRSGKDDLTFSEYTENIHTLNFEKMIEEALRSRHYRRVVRLYYLQSLRQLSDKNKITWEINKTNRDYRLELEKSSLGHGFESITYLYEYVWYGNTELDDEKFSTIKAEFQEFQTRTSAER